MKTVSSVVENYIKTKPFLLGALSQGIINLTSLSRNMMTELEDDLGKEVKQGGGKLKRKREIIVKNKNDKNQQDLNGNESGGKTKMAVKTVKKDPRKKKSKSRKWSNNGSSGEEDEGEEEEEWEGEE